MASVSPLHGRDELMASEMEEAVAAFLRSRDLQPRTQHSYGQTFAKLEAAFAGRSLAAITSDEVQEFLTEHWGGAAATTYNRHRAALSSLWRWAIRTGRATGNPVEVLERRTQRRTPRQEQQARAVPYEELAALWRDRRHPLRDRALWALLYETAARAEEILALDVSDLDTSERTAVITGKGGGAERIFWATTSARLLDRYLEGRRRGPVFLTERRPRQAMAAGDTDPDTGRVRLSYRRAAEAFTEASGGLTLHQLRHSALTHLAEQGVDATLLRAKSRHASLRSLEPYVSPSDTAVKALTDAHDPAARRRR